VRITLALIGLLAAALPLAAQSNNSYLIRGATVYPVSGPKVENASVLILDGKIADIGDAKLAAPKARKDVKVVEAKGLHVYPGMIDSASEVGIAEIGSIRETSDTGEIGTFNPQLRPLIAVNPDSEHIPVTRANGITSVMVLPAAAGGGGRGGGGGSIIAGQVSLINLNGWTWEEMEVKRDAAVYLRFPVIAGGGGGRGFGGGGRGAGAGGGGFAEARRAYEAQVRTIHTFFEEARRYQRAKKAGDPSLKTDLKLEAMLPVLEGQRPVMMVVTREREIRDAIEFADKEKIKIVLAGVRRPGKALELIKSKNIPVILGSTLALPLEEDDPYDSAFTLPGELHKAGVKFAFASFDNQFARNLPYEAAQAAAFGLPYEEALKSITLNAAEIWGVGDQYGSIDKGKYANLMVTDGDPLEIKTQVKMVFIKGQQVDLESKHTKLYKRYLARP